MDFDFNVNLFITFCILNTLNVVIQTIKSLVTIRAGKLSAALINALAYGFYSVVIVYTVCDLPLMLKAVVVAIANLIGVYFVKMLEEKSRKTKLWKVELTLRTEDVEKVKILLDDVSYSTINLGKHTLFAFYCETKQQSAKVKNICDQFNGKYFVSESKTL